MKITQDDLDGTLPDCWVEDGSRWVVWQEDESGRKRPRNPRWGRAEDIDGWSPAGAKHPDAWMDHDEVERWVDHGSGMGRAYYLAKPGYSEYPDPPKYDYEPIDLPQEKHVCLGDWDDVLDPETGEVHPLFDQMLGEYDHTYSDISPSGAGGHTYFVASLPDGETAFTVDISTDRFPDAEVEVYDGGRFTTVTGDHISETSTDINEAQGLVDELYEMVPDEDQGSFDTDLDDWETDRSRDEVLEIEEATDFDQVVDAIKHVRPRDIRLGRWSRTEKRGDGTQSFDHPRVNSKSGTRIGWAPDIGWIYRQGSQSIDALQIVAFDERIITSVTDYPRGQDFKEAVDALRDRGAHIPEYDWTSARPDSSEDEPEPSALIPVQALEYFSHDERRRLARKYDIDWPDVDEVRDRIGEGIRDSMDDGDPVVIDSPTGSGKTYYTATEDWLAKDEITDGKPVIHAHRTKEARDQAADMTREYGGDCFKLQSRGELCPIAGGAFDPDNEHDNEEIRIQGKPASEWFDDRCDKQGIPFSVAHEWAEEIVPGNLPCCRDDTDCAGKRQFDDVPRDDDGNVLYDVVHCTHQFLLVPSLRMHTNVVIDEKPAFGVDIPPERIKQSITEYLQWADAPVQSWRDLTVAAEHSCEPGHVGAELVGGVVLGEYKKGFAERMDEALNAEPDLTFYRENPHVHALAPALARAVWSSEPAMTGRRSSRVPYRPPRLDDKANDTSGWNRVFVDVVLNDDWEVEDVECSPDFSLTNSTVGLDAHPQPSDPWWQSRVHLDIETERVLDHAERALYRRYERGLFVVQVGENTQPVTRDTYLSDGQGKRIRAMVDHLHNEYGDEFSTAITSNAVESFLKGAMRNAGIENPETMHYGEEESRNDFEGEEAGLVFGCIDPGDDNILNMLARLGLDAEPAKSECGRCDGTGEPTDDDRETCKVCGGDGISRDNGRGFVGPDADMAEAVLRGVREHHVAQSAGRWARRADDPTDTATVYVATDATPPGFTDATVPGVEWLPTDGQRERLEYLATQPTGSTAKEIADATGCDKSTAWDTLETAEEYDLVDKHPGAGSHGATIYTPKDTFSKDGAADLGATGGIIGDRVQDSCTWTPMIRTSLGAYHPNEPNTHDPLKEQLPIDRFIAGVPTD